MCIKGIQLAYQYCWALTLELHNRNNGTFWWCSRYRQAKSQVSFSAHRGSKRQVLQLSTGRKKWRCLLGIVFESSHAGSALVPLGYLLYLRVLLQLVRDLHFNAPVRVQLFLVSTIRCSMFKQALSVFQPNWKCTCARKHGSSSVLPFNVIYVIECTWPIALNFLKRTSPYGDTLLIRLIHNAWHLSGSRYPISLMCGKILLSVVLLGRRIWKNRLNLQSLWMSCHMEIVKFPLMRVRDGWYT